MAADNKNFIVKNGLTAQGGIQSDSDVDVTGDISATGSIIATGSITGASFSGSLPAASLTGTIDSARIPGLQTADVVAGTFVDARIPNLATSKITSGTFDSARLPALSTSDISNGIFDSARIPGLQTADVVAGTFALARIPTIALTTNTSGNYVQSATAGLGIKSLSAAGEGVDQTIAVDSGFVTGLFSAAEGISYSGGVIGLDATDSATFANVTVTNEFAVFDSANGEEVAKFAGDPSTGLTIHSHAHATDGGIRFVIHNTADSDYLILSQPTGISAVNRRIRDVGAPTSDKDAATKSYVDGVAQGLAIRDPAKVATTAALTSTNDITAITYDSGALGFGAKILITATTGLDSIDGFTLSAGNRIIVKDETGANLPFNGIYSWDSAKGITRTTDMDSGSEFNGGEFVFVQEGTINGGNGFSQKDNVNIVGDSAVHFVQFSGAGQITAGQGISKTGNTLAVDLSGTPGLEFSSNELQAKVDGLTIERVSGGLAVKDNGITTDKFFTTGGTGVTLTNIATNAAETFSTAGLRDQLEDGIYKVYTTAIGDSDTTALVDSAYVRPLARAAITAGSNITYDSATGVISGAASLIVQEEGGALSTAATTLNFVGPNITASGTGATKTITVAAGYTDADVTAHVDSAYVQLRADSDYIKTVADSDYIKTVTDINAATLGGQAIGAFLRSDATDAYTSGTLTFDNAATVAFAKTTGTSPFTVASTTVVTNLNADRLDGQHGAYYRIDILDSAGTTLNT